MIRNPALAVGAGGLRGDTLAVRYDVRCYNGMPVGPVTVTYTYAAATNTLTDSIGVVWIHSRADHPQSRA